jgi:hypothetical protein
MPTNAPKFHLVSAGDGATGASYQFASVILLGLVL